MTPKQHEDLMRFIHTAEGSMPTPHKDEIWMDLNIDAIRDLTVTGQLSHRRHQAVCRWRMLMRLRDGLDHYDDCVCNECMRKWDAKEAALEDGRAL